MSQSTQLVARTAKPSRMKSAFLSWLGIPVSLTNGQWITDVFGVANSAGECVTQDTALRLSAVWACVRLIAGTIATLPLNLYEKAGQARTVAEDHPLYPILKLQPNADMTPVQFWEAFLTSMLLNGNGFAEILRRGDGEIVALEFLIPQRVSAKRQKDGAWLYTYIDPVDGKSRPIREEDMFHVPGFTLDGVFGLSTIQYGANILGNAMAAERASSSLFQNGMRIQGVFEFDHVVKKDQREAFQATLEKYRGAINAGGTPLLEAGIHYKSITMNAEDAELLASRGFSIELICSWFAVPPFMIGHGEKSNAWPSSIEAQLVAFVIYCLTTWMVRIEQGVSKKLIKPAERTRFFAKFNLEGLLRGDSAARKEWYATLIRLGVMSRDEAREKENLEPIPGGGGAIYTTEANQVPVDSYAPKETDPLDGTTDVQGTALNGAQVAALQAIVVAAAQAQLPVATAAALIKAAFPLLSDAQIQAIVSPLAGFEPPPAPVAKSPAVPAPDPGAAP